MGRSCQKDGDKKQVPAQHELGLQERVGSVRHFFIWAARLKFVSIKKLVVLIRIDSAHSNDISAGRNPETFVARNSAGRLLLRTAGCTGSIPVVPTIDTFKISLRR